ncbi:MAG TPA: hypothetical protein VMA13_05060, partial [Candidatus Saccharimonadales bacterium]|nr:hypothetical protein [Candidatus Saccharimonadales bacterium]
MKVLITGFNDLIGSKVVSHHDTEEHKVQGIDKDIRRKCFGHVRKPIELLNDCANKAGIPIDYELDI